MLLKDRENDMVTLRVIGGTPQVTSSLCNTCTRGHVIRGFRTTELLVFCRYFYIEREILFPVRECTFYEDSRLATKDDMVEIAWHLRSKPSRNVGFASGSSSNAIDSRGNDSQCDPLPENSRT